MKALLPYFPFAAPRLGPAHATYPHHRASHPRPVATPATAAAPKVYVCGGGSAYAYHSSANCAGLTRWCSFRAMKHILLAAGLLLVGCSTQHLTQSTKHRQRVNQRSRDHYRQHDQKIQKRNFFNI